MFRGNLNIKAPQSEYMDLSKLIIIDLSDIMPLVVLDTSPSPNGIQQLPMVDAYFMQLQTRKLGYHLSCHLVIHNVKVKILNRVLNEQDSLNSNNFQELIRILINDILPFPTLMASAIANA